LRRLRIAEVTPVLPIRIKFLRQVRELARHPDAAPLIKIGRQRALDVE